MLEVGNSLRLTFGKPFRQRNNTKVWLVYGQAKSNTGSNGHLDPESKWPRTASTLSRLAQSSQFRRMKVVLFCLTWADSPLPIGRLTDLKNQMQSYAHRYGAKRPESQRRMSRNYQSKKMQRCNHSLQGPVEGRQCLDKSRWIFVDHLLLNVPRISPWTGIGSANILTFFYIMEQSYQRTSTSTTSQHPR